jgi:hypothetical protein
MKLVRRFVQLCCLVALSSVAATASGCTECTWAEACSSDDPDIVVTRNTCTGEEIYFRTCGTIDADTCVDGGCGFPEDLFVSAVLSFQNASFGFIRAEFPLLFASELDASDAISIETCRAIAGAELASRPLKSVAVQQVVIENPAGTAQAIPASDGDSDRPFYLLFNGGDFPADDFAESVWTWRVIGANGVPSFDATIKLPTPLHEFSPRPLGEGLVDFARSAPPTFRWDAAGQADEFVDLSFSGTNASGTDSLLLQCLVADDGSFTPSPQQMADFFPGPITITIGRFRSEASDVGIPLRNSAGSPFLELDGEGPAASSVYTVR